MGRKQICCPRKLFVQKISIFFFRYLFWSNIGKASKIERSTLSGKSIKTIAKTSLGKPTGITIDDEDGRLLWIDSTTYRVESVDFNGTDQRSMFEIKKRQNYETVHSLAYNPTTKMAFVADYDVLFSIQNTSSETMEKPIVFGRFGTPFNVKILLNSTSNGMFLAVVYLFHSVKKI